MSILFGSHKLLAVVLALFLVIGCGGKPRGEKSDRKIVVATTTIIADIAQNIASGLLDVRTIMPVGGDPHVYKPVPGDARLIAESDLVLLNGLQLEGWLEELARNAGGSCPMVTVSEGVVPLRDEKRHGDPDPHCWFDVRMVKIFVDNILNAFIEIDPENREYYAQNATKYKEALDTLHDWVQYYVAQLPKEKRVLITSHDAFRYFGEAYGFAVLAVQGINTEAQAQTEDVVRLVKYINEKKVPSVFIETSVNPKMLEQIARDTGARVGGKLFSDSLGHPDEEGGTYISMVRHNVKTIVNALLQVGT